MGTPKFIGTKKYKLGQKVWYVHEELNEVISCKISGIEESNIFPEGKNYMLSPKNPFILKGFLHKEIFVSPLHECRICTKELEAIYRLKEILRCRINRDKAELSRIQNNLNKNKARLKLLKEK